MDIFRFLLSKVGKANTLVANIIDRVDGPQKHISDDPETIVASDDPTKTHTVLSRRTKIEHIGGNRERPAPEGEVDTNSVVTRDLVHPIADIHRRARAGDGGVDGGDVVRVPDDERGAGVDDDVDGPADDGGPVHRRAVHLHLPVPRVRDVCVRDVARVVRRVRASEEELGGLSRGGELEPEDGLGQLTGGDEGVHEGGGVEVGEGGEAEAHDAVGGEFVVVELGRVFEGRA